MGMDIFLPVCIKSFCKCEEVDSVEMAYFHVL